MKPDVFLSVEAAVKEIDGAAQQLLNNAYQANPRLHGAPIADVIDIYMNHDGCLNFTEPLWEKHEEEFKATGIPTKFISTAAYAVAIIVHPKSYSFMHEDMYALLVLTLARSAYMKSKEHESGRGGTTIMAYMRGKFYIYSSSENMNFHCPDLKGSLPTDRAEDLAVMMFYRMTPEDRKVVMQRVAERYTGNFGADGVLRELEMRTAAEMVEREAKALGVQVKHEGK